MISRIKSRQSRLVIPFDPNRNYKASSVILSHMVCEVSTLHSDHYNALLDSQFVRSILIQVISLWFSVGICKYKPGYKSHDLL